MNGRVVMKEVWEVSSCGDKRRERIVDGRVVERLVEEKNSSGDIRKEYSINGQLK